MATRTLKRTLSELADAAIDDQSGPRWSDPDVVARMKERAARLNLDLNDFQDEVFQRAAAQRIHARAKPIPALEQLKLFSEDDLAAIIIPLGVDENGIAQRVKLSEANFDALNIKMDHELEQLEDVANRVNDSRKTIAAVRPLMQRDPTLTFPAALRQLGYLTDQQRRGDDASASVSA